MPSTAGATMVAASPPSPAAGCAPDGRGGVRRPCPPYSPAAALADALVGPAAHRRHGDGRPPRRRRRRPTVQRWKVRATASAAAEGGVHHHVVHRRTSAVAVSIATITPLPEASPAPVFTTMLRAVGSRVETARGKGRSEEGRERSRGGCRRSRSLRKLPNSRLICLVSARGRLAQSSEHGTSAAMSESASPSTRSSGPHTTRRSRGRRNATTAAWSDASSDTTRTPSSTAMPALPGAQNRSPQRLADEAPAQRVARARRRPRTSTFTGAPPAAAAGAAATSRQGWTRVRFFEAETAREERGVDAGTDWGAMRARGAARGVRQTAAAMSSAGELIGRSAEGRDVLVNVRSTRSRHRETRKVRCTVLVARDDSGPPPTERLVSVPVPAPLLVRRQPRHLVYELRELRRHLRVRGVLRANARRAARRRRRRRRRAAGRRAAPPQKLPSARAG